MDDTLELVGTFIGRHPQEIVTSPLQWVYAGTTITGEFPSNNIDDYIIKVTSASISTRDIALDFSGAALPNITAVTENSMTISNTGARAINRPNASTITASASVAYSGEIYYKK